MRAESRPFPPRISFTPDAAERERPPPSKQPVLGLAPREIERKEELTLLGTQRSWPRNPAIQNVGRGKPSHPGSGQNTRSSTGADPVKPWSTAAKNCTTEST